MYSAMETMFHSSGSNSNSEMLRYKRDIPPAHYTFKIESFSLLVQTKVDKIESAMFEAGGYKWRMVLYPHGNTKNNGEDFLSVYLVIEETKVLPQRWEVNAVIKLFVFDHKENNYLTVQDSENGGITHLHTNKTECGFAKFLPLEMFNDTCNHGFINDDCCVFGAEVFVIKPSNQSCCLSMAKQPDHGKFTWKIDKFFSLDQTSYFSNSFTIGGKKWKLKIFPKGTEKAKGDWFSLYLFLSDYETLPPKGTVYVEFKLRIIDQRRDHHVEKSTNHWFTKASNIWGYMEAVRLGDLHEQSKGFIMNDTLIVEAQIDVISVTKCFN